MAATTTTMLTGKRMPRWLAGATAGALVLLGAPAIGLAPASAATIGGFEIDGNFAVTTSGNEDWASLTSVGSLPDANGRTFRTVATVLDNTVGGQDDTLLGANDKENSPPWTQQTSGNVAGKSDFGRMGAYTFIKDDHVFLNLGFDRGSNSGGNATAGYWFELNQIKQAGQNPNPIRSNGDVRFLIQDQGSGIFSAPSFYKWTNGAWALGAPPNPVYDVKSNAGVSVSGMPSWWLPTPNVSNGSITPEGFVEASIDLTSFGAVLGCPSSGFAALNSRSTTGNTDNNLQDYVEAIGITIPSECAKLDIYKYDTDGMRLPGATFEVTPNPIPGAQDPKLLSVTDGGANDSDGTANGVISIASAKPGTYTVTELTAPAGYIKVLQPQQVTLTKYGSSRVNFTNPLGAIRWLKTYGDGETPATGATFSVARTSGPGTFSTITGYSQPFTVVDNGTKDEDPTLGEIEVSGLPVGAYSITETTPPVGYGKDSGTATVTIPATAATLAAALEPHQAGYTFANPRLKGALTVEKLGQPGDVPVAGATFALWKVVGQPDISSTETDDVRLTAVEPITTGADGRATVTGLSWGRSYYFEELTAPSPWNLPDYPYTDVEALTAQDATDKVVTVLSIDDPRSAIVTSATPVVKLPGAPIKDQATLTGVRADAGGTITFTLYGPYAANATPTCNAEDALVLDEVTVNGPGQYDSPEVTPTEAGRYFWIASYSGDQATNTWAVSGQCGDANETTLVEKATPGISTTAGGKNLVQGESYLPEAKIYDVATVSGLTYNATGTVTFKVFAPGDATCSAAPLATYPVALTTPVLGQSGYASVVTSPDYTATVAGTYRWTAAYSGDANNVEDTEPCNSPNESWVVNKAPTSITTDTRTAQGQDTKLPGTSLVDTATLTGLTANAGGSVTFKLYDATCTTALWTSDPQPVVGPHPGGSATVTSPAYTGTLDAGTYAWKATYSGDANNETSTHPCGSTTGGNYEIHVIQKADPSISTTATDATLAAGDGETFVTDTAFLSGLTADASGTVVFTVYGPFADEASVVCNAGTLAGEYDTSFDGSDVIAGSVSIVGAVKVGDAGYYAWKANYLGDGNNNPVTHTCGDITPPNDEISKVDPRQPEITTTATRVVNLAVDENASATISDSATITGLTGDAAGSVTFRVYGPVAAGEGGGEPTAVCETQVGEDIVVALGDVDADGTAVVASSEVTVTAPGYYFWVAEYTSTTGDNLGVAGACGDKGETSLVTQADPGISKVVKDSEGNELTPSFPDAIEVGDVLTYDVTVSNTGTADATDDVTDVLPEFVSYVDGSASNGGVYDANTHTITWSDITVAGGDSLTLTYDVEVLEGAASEGNDILINKASWFELEATTETWVKWIELSANERCDADTPVVDYQVVTHNLDPLATPAYTVDLQWVYTVDDADLGISAGDPVPTDVTTIDGTPQQLNDLPLPSGTLLYPGTKTEGGDTIDWPGWVNEGTVSAPVWKQVGDGLTPSVALVGTVNPTDQSQVLYPPSTAPCFAPPGVPSLEKSSPTEQGSELNPTGLVAPGDDVRYSITLVNNGGTAVTSDLVDTLPDGVENPRNFTPADPTSTVGQTLTWADVTLQPGEQVTYEFDVTVGLDQEDGVQLVNNATWAGLTDKTVHSVTVEPVPTPVPTLDKDANPAPGSTVKAGDVITYTVKLGNTGDGPAFGDLVDTLPAGVEVVGNFTKDGAAFEPDSVTATTITWNDVTVAPDQTVIFTYDVKVLDSNADGAKLVNTARWLGLEDDTTHTVVVDSPGLPQTGAEVLTMLLWASLLLAIGAMFVAFGRRREADQG